MYVGMPLPHLHSPSLIFALFLLLLPLLVSPLNEWRLWQRCKNTRSKSFNQYDHGLTHKLQSIHFVLYQIFSSKSTHIDSHYCSRYRYNIFPRTVFCDFYIGNLHWMLTRVTHFEFCTVIKSKILSKGWQQFHGNIFMKLHSCNSHQLQSAAWLAEQA